VFISRNSQESQVVPYIPSVHVKCLFEHHQTNDVIAQSGKCHVTSLAVGDDGKREKHANLWPAHELQTDTSWHR
jgi:hypothetical protein